MLHRYIYFCDVYIWDGIEERGEDLRRGGEDWEAIDNVVEAGDLVVASAF